MPTLAPYVNHTWYCDLKGPFPMGTGYLMAVVEPITRRVLLRYLPRGTAAEVIDELSEEVRRRGNAGDRRARGRGGRERGGEDETRRHFWSGDATRAVHVRRNLGDAARRSTMGPDDDENGLALTIETLSDRSSPTVAVVP